MVEGKSRGILLAPVVAGCERHRVDVRVDGGGVEEVVLATNPTEAEVRRALPVSTAMIASKSFSSASGMSTTSLP